MKRGLKRVCPWGGLVALLVLLSPAVARAQIQLQWKFKPGESFMLTTLQDMDMKMELMGNTTEMAGLTTIETGVAVDEVSADGVSTLTISIERFATEMDGGPQGKFVLDTASDELAQGPFAELAPLFEALTQMHYELQLRPDGEVTELEVDAEALQKALDALGPQAAQAAQMLDKDRITQASARWMRLPAGPVEVGDTWEDVQKTEVPIAGTVEARTVYEYLGLEEVDGRKLAKISMKTDVDLGELMRQVLPDVEIKVDGGALEGVCYFDPEAGRLVSQELKQNIKMEFSSNDGRSMTQNVASTVTVRLEPVETK